MREPFRKKLPGGVFFTVILLIFMLSSTYLYLMNNHKIEMRSKIRMEDHYIVCIMENMTLAHLADKWQVDADFTPGEVYSGQLTYNEGAVEYVLNRDNQLKLTTVVRGNAVRVKYFPNYSPSSDLVEK